MLEELKRKGAVILSFTSRTTTLHPANLCALR